MKVIMEPEDRITIKLLLRRTPVLSEESQQGIEAIDKQNSLFIVQSGSERTSE